MNTTIETGLTVNFTTGEINDVLTVIYKRIEYLNLLAREHDTKAFNKEIFRLNDLYCKIYTACH